LGLSVIFGAGNKVDVDECAVAGKVIVPLVEMGEVEELDPPWFVGGGKRPRGGGGGGG
jgi:hypothetical protein